MAFYESLSSQAMFDCIIEDSTFEQGDPSNVYREVNVVVQ